MEHKFETIISKVKNPAVLIIGRGKKGHYKCYFDENTQNQKYLVFKLDIETESDPDIVVDFNDHNHRLSIIKKIGSKYNIIHIQFDFDVFKFMTKLPLLFKDIYQMLESGGVFIFPYEIRGGCITFSEENCESSVIDFNCIDIPQNYYKFLETIQEKIVQSMQMIKSELDKLFQSVDIVYDKSYPFFEAKCTYYVCIKQ